MNMKSKTISPPPHGNCIYPWSRWENGEWHHARQGRDFKIARNTFRSSLFSRAFESGLKVETRTQKNKPRDVWFRFLPKSP